MLKMIQVMIKVLFISALLALPITALAAGSCVVSPTSVQGSGFMQITVVCTADSTAATYPVTLIDYDLFGKYLFSVNTYFDAVTPATNNTDLEILDSATGNDILNGAGLNQLDIAANTHFKPIVNDPTGTAKDTLMPVYTPLYIKITNNSVNSAIVRIVLKFIE